MNKLLFSFFLGLIISSCSHDDDVNQIELAEINCQVLKYQQLIILDSILYRTSLVYEGNKVMQRLNYGNILSGSTGQTRWGLSSFDNIFYNSENKVSKIEYAANRFDLFYYTDGNPNPFKREYIRISDDGYVSKWSENITYDESGRISNTFFYADDPNYPYVEETTINYIYNSDSNLAKIIEVYRTSGNTTTTTVDYSEYDSHKNPFKNINVPFIENRPVQFSRNNYKKKHTKTIYTDGETYSSDFEYGFSYNEYDYPLIAEYNCH